MRNYLYIFLLLIMTSVLASCGSGATGGDPLGLDAITVNPPTISLSAGQSSVITATVKHANGTAATGRTVSFSFAANNSAGTLTVTDSGTNTGIATATYTAGANTPASSIQDIVQASISNGASVPVIITRTAASGGGAVGGLVASLVTSQSTVSAGQSSIITANITDNTNAPLNGATVTFSLPVKGSGTPTLSSTNVVTDGSGKAVTVYTPGAGSPTLAVNDAIQATLANGSSQVITVTRSSQTSATNTVALASSCSTNTPNVAPSNSCVITATVKNASGSVVNGITVTFAIVVSGTGAPSLIPAAGSAVTTDGNGNANTTYTAGAIAGKTDVITATITGGDAAIVITD